MRHVLRAKCEVRILRYTLNRDMCTVDNELSTPTSRLPPHELDINVATKLLLTNQRRQNEVFARTEQLLPLRGGKDARVDEPQIVKIWPKN